MSPIDFTENYEDLSTDLGYQFRFYCERCDADYLSEFQPRSPQDENGLLEGMGEMLVEGTEERGEVRATEGDPEHEAALQAAIAEVKEHFHQCPRCGEWVCDLCWNAAMLMCEKCAPDMGEEDEDEAESAGASRDRVTCPHCGEETPRSVFCSACGWPLEKARRQAG
ncbi:MAG: hypothetical protein U9R79_15750 [Armatimonadota bacterium]|nr:hypothetical protein [Armatimonadota bacterium]